MTGSWIAACSSTLHPQPLFIPSVSLIPSRQVLYWLTVYPRSQWFTILPNQSTGIIVEPDRHAILPLHLFRCPHDDCVSDIPSPDFVCCCCGGIPGASITHRAVLLYHHYDTIALYAVSELRVYRLWRRAIPIRPCLFMRRFATHSTIVAPELSMQFSMV